MAQTLSDGAGGVSSLARRFRAAVSLRWREISSEFEKCRAMLGAANAGSRAYRKRARADSRMRIRELSGAAPGPLREMPPTARRSASAAVRHGLPYPFERALSDRQAYLYHNSPLHAEASDG